MADLKNAFLVLDDGRIFEGQSWAAEGEGFGEAVFTTGMTGYQETLTDPSYHKQIVVMTPPPKTRSNSPTPLLLAFALAKSTSPIGFAAEVMDPATNESFFGAAISSTLLS